MVEARLDVRFAVADDLSFAVWPEAVAGLLPSMPGAEGGAGGGGISLESR